MKRGREKNLRHQQSLLCLVLTVVGTSELMAAIYAPLLAQKMLASSCHQEQERIDYSLLFLNFWTALMGSLVLKQQKSIILWCL